MARGRKKKVVEEELEVDFGGAEETVEETDAEEYVVEGVEIPQYNSDEWESFVLSQLKDNEKDGDYPKCNGLRRLGSKLLGTVVYNGPTQVFPPNNDANIAPRAAVLYKIEIDWTCNKDWIPENQILTEDIRTFCDAADCDFNNTSATYAVHALATATTRAEARCWKKALGLSILTAEEANNDNEPEKVVHDYRKSIDTEPDDNGKISASQEKMIKSQCAKLEIDVVKFINMEFDDIKMQLKDLDKETARAKMRQLNEYQSTENSNSIPESIKKG